MWYIIARKGDTNDHVRKDSNITSKRIVPSCSQEVKSNVIICNVVIANLNKETNVTEGNENLYTDAESPNIKREI